MTEKKDVDDLLAQSKQWAGWQDELCAGCKEIIINKLRPVQRAYNQGGLKRRWAEARLASMTLTLWRHLCHKCLRKVKHKMKVKA